VRKGRNGCKSPTKLVAPRVEFTTILTPRTAGWAAFTTMFTRTFECISRFRRLVIRTSFDPCWKDLSESDHQYYDQTTCIHLPDSTHSSSTHADCCYCCRASLLPRQRKNVACTTDSELLIGSTHGLGWVGSDWVEILKRIFSELGWVVDRKKCQ